MGWISLFLERIIGWVSGKKALIPKSTLTTDFKKLVQLHRLYSIKTVVKNNFDLKPGILKLFFWSYWIDGILFVSSIVINSLSIFLFFVHFFNYQNSELLGDVPKWNWIAQLIFTILLFLFLIRWINDYYKLSLRDKYRNNYLKLLWLDVLTFNFLNIIGILIFTKNKKQISNLSIDNQTIKQVNLSSQAIKNFSKIITKVEVFILLFNLIILTAAILIGYFVKIKIIKLICIIISFLIFIFIQGWSLQKIIGLIIVRKLLKNLLNDNNYYLLLSIIRFLGFTFGTYYIAVFINILKFDENYKEFIMEKW